MEVEIPVLDEFLGLADAEALDKVALGVDLLVGEHFIERFLRKILPAVVLSVVHQHGIHAGEILRADQQSALTQVECLAGLSFFL